MPGNEVESGPESGRTLSLTLCRSRARGPPKLTTYARDVTENTYKLNEERLAKLAKSKKLQSLSLSLFLSRFLYAKKNLDDTNNHYKLRNLTDYGETFDRIDITRAVCT